MNVAFELQDRQVTALFATLSQFAVDPKPTLTDIGAEMKESTRMRFNAGVSPAGAKWQPLAWSTIIGRASRGGSMRRGGRNVTKGGLFRAGFARKVGGSHQPLMDTRTHLFNSVGYRVQGTSVVVGVAPNWAGIHQFGGMAGRGRKVRIPARPFLGVSIEDRRAIVAILTRRTLAAATTSLGANA